MGQLSLTDLEALPEAQAPSPMGPPAPDSDPGMSWGDTGLNAVKSLPHSALEFGKAVVQPIAHPIDTAKALWNTGSGVVSKAEGALGIEQDPVQKADREAQANAVGQFFADRYGSMEKFKHTLANDPVGIAADLSTVFTGGETALARLPGIAGKVGEAAGTAGRMIDPVRAAGKVGSAVANGAGNAASHALGLVTGVGSVPVKTGFEAGYANNRAFPEAMRGNAPMTDAVDMTDSALGKMRADLSAAYRNDFGAVKASTKQLDFHPIYHAMNDAYNDVHFRGVAKSEEAASVIRNIASKVDEFHDATTLFDRPAEAFDAMKQAIGEIRQKTMPGSLERRISDQIYNTVKGELVRQVPEYAKTMANYARGKDVINDTARTFSIGEKYSPDTTLRKLQSVMRNNVSTNYGSRTKTMKDVLAVHEPDLPVVLAGHAMSSVLPRGLAGLGPLAEGAFGVATMNPAMAVGVLASSPRLIGELSYGAGRGVAAAERALQAVGVNSESLPGILQGLYQAGRLPSG